MATHSPDQPVGDIQQALNTAIQHHATGRLAEAEQIYRQILEKDSNEPRALQLLGAIAHQTGKNEVAVDFFRQALAAKPDYLDAHYNLGLALRALGRLEEAADSYRACLTIKPDFVMAHSDLGVTLQDIGDLQGAAESFQKALSIKPDFAEVHGNLGIALQKLGQLDDAVDSFQTSLKLKPEHAPTHNNLGLVLLEMGKVDEAIASYRQALTLKPDYPKAHSNLLLALNYHSDYAPADKLEEARRYGSVIAGASSGPPTHSNVRDPERRLKVGFVSGDFRYHSVSHFLLGVLPHIDAAAFETFAYFTHRREDDVTRQLKQGFAKWRSVAGETDERLIETIASDGIDILIDLAGHSANNRLAVFARKPAPVQVTWLGYSGTTGLGTMDYILSDQRVIPPSEEQHYVETSWRLPDSYLCYSPPAEDIPVGPGPCETNAFVTFGSFNNLNKVTDATLACWAELLLAVPDSRLLLKSRQLGHEAVQQGVLERLGALGVTQDRVELHGRISTPAEHLALYNQIDIALDPFPYCGTTTTAEALWMGVPVVTLRGRGFVERVGESILNTIGHDEWIADTPAGYVATALALADDREALANLRPGLRQSIVSSPFCDAPRFAGHLETALRKMWRGWCESQISRHV